MSRLPVFILLFSLIVIAGCGGGNSTSNAGNNTVTPAGASNTVAITAGGGPQNITNGVFTSVTVCSPGSTTNCATIGGILVDTGSFGLRIVSGALPPGFSLPQQTDTSGNPIGECTVFADGFSWGGVVTADMTIAGEKASSMGVQILNGTFGGGFPTACANAGGGPQFEEDTQQQFGSNGVIGVGNFAQDCGTFCVTNVPSPTPIYWSCPASGCVGTTEPLASQVVNPVALFATDNNGVIVELPSISASGAPSANGTLVFGIGTQSNNGLGSATVLTLDNTGAFTTSFLGNSIPGSFVDSGSTDLFFADNNLAMCGSGNTSVFCPTNNPSFSAINQGTNGATSTVNFSVTDGNALPVQDAVFNDLAAPVPSTISGFDWGLPFFFGRNVFVAIAGANTPGGAGPYTAY